MMTYLALGTTIPEALWRTRDDSVTIFFSRAVRPRNTLELPLGQAVQFFWQTLLRGKTAPFLGLGVVLSNAAIGFCEGDSCTRVR
jgi:hypothetical protein